MTKKYAVFLSALFCLFLGGMLALSLLLPKEDFSQLENRYLQKTPTFTLETVENGKFMKQAEDYVSDHIAGRDMWVALKSWSERLSGKQENNAVYFATGDALISRVPQPDQNKLSESIAYLDTLVGNLSVPVYFGLIPSAAEIWRDRLPANAPTADERALIEQMYFSTGANTVDIYSALNAHKEESLYYRTDHHWTSLGAYYGYVALMEAMGLPPVSLTDYEKTTVSDQFYGTLFSSSGVRWVAPDAIDTYVSGAGVEVTSYFNSSPVPGALYAEDFLSKKDKYSYFLGGNQPLCVVKTQHTDAPKVLVIRDSYSDSLAPFLTESFSEVHLFDLRYNLNSVSAYVVEHAIDRVVVLYSFSNFIAEQNLFLLSR